MHVWKYKPGILDPPDVEEEDQAILQYLRHGGILLGDRIGEIEGFVPADKPYRHVPEPEPKHVPPEEFIGPRLPADYGVRRCVQCNRSLPLGATWETCSTECQETIDSFREYVLTWMGMK